MAIVRRDGYRLWVGGPVPRGMSAVTIGTTIIVRSGRESSEYLLRHERVHVRQWKRYGRVGFLVRYLGAYLIWRLRRKGHLGAYLRIPLEIEADWIARRSIATAVTDDLSSEVALR